MVSAHILNSVILLAPIIGDTIGNMMNSTIISYVMVAILLLGIMYWREKSYCNDQKIEYKEFFTDYLILYVVGYIISPMIVEYIPILGTVMDLPIISIFSSGIIFLCSFLLFKLFTKKPCA